MPETSSVRLPKHSPKQVHQDPLFEILDLRGVIWAPANMAPTASEKRISKTINVDRYQIAVPRSAFGGEPQQTARITIFFEDNDVWLIPRGTYGYPGDARHHKYEFCIPNRKEAIKLGTYAVEPGELAPGIPGLVLRGARGTGAPTFQPHRSRRPQRTSEGSQS